MKFQGMDKATAKRIGEIAGEAMSSALAQHGVTVSRKGGTFDPAAGTLGIRFTFSVEGAANPDEHAFAKYQPRVFPRWNLGDEFTSNSVVYRLSGYRPRATKRPFLGTRVSDGKVFVFGFDAIERNLGTRDGAPIKRAIRGNAKISSDISDILSFIEN